MKMIRLHQGTDLMVLVNPDRIETVRRGQNESLIFLSGRDKALRVKEDPDVIYTMIRDAYS